LLHIFQRLALNAAKACPLKSTNNAGFVAFSAMLGSENLFVNSI